MVKPLFRLLVKVVGSVLLGLTLIAVGGSFWFLRSGPEPKVWHTAHLEQEFTPAKAGNVQTIADYRALEDRLFAELKTKVVDRLEPGDRTPFNRFNAGNRSDPAIWPTQREEAADAVAAGGCGLPVGSPAATWWRERG